MKLADSLRVVKATIETRGWRSGAWQTHNVAGYPKFDHNVCIYEAIFESRAPFRAQMLEILRTTLAVDGLGRGVDLIDWNDARGRTVEQVYAAIDRAIATVEGRA